MHFFSGQPESVSRDIRYCAYWTRLNSVRRSFDTNWIETLQIRLHSRFKNLLEPI